MQACVALKELCFDDIDLSRHSGACQPWMTKVHTIVRALIKRCMLETSKMRRRRKAAETVLTLS